MKKWIGLIAIVIAGAVMISGPLITGSQTQKSYQVLLHKLAKTPGVSITENSYKNGYLHATALTTFAFQDISKPQKKQTIQIKTNISNGIFSATTVSELVLKKSFLDKVKSVIGDKPPVILKGRFSIFGGAELDLSTLSLNYNDKKSQEQIQISPFYLSVDFSSDFNRFLVNGSWKGAKIESKNGNKLVFNSLTYHQAGHRFADNVWLGRFEVVLDSISTKSKMQSELNAKLIKIVGETNKDDDAHFSSSASFKVSRIDFQNLLKKEDSFDITNSVFDIAINKIAIDEFEALMALSDGYRKADQITDPAEQIRSQMEMMSKLLKASTALLNKGLVITIPKLAFSNAGGRAKASLYLKQKPGTWDINQSYKGLLQNTAGTLKIDIPEKILRFLPEKGKAFRVQLDRMMRSKLITLKNGHYQTKAKLNGLDFYLNGKKIPLPKL